MWLGFDFQTRCHMWIEFVGSLLCSERFFPGYSGFPLPWKTCIWLNLLRFVHNPHRLWALKPIVFKKGYYFVIRGELKFNLCFFLSLALLGGSLLQKKRKKKLYTKGTLSRNCCCRRNNNNHQLITVEQNHSRSGCHQLKTINTREIRS